MSKPSTELLALCFELPRAANGGSVVEQAKTITLIPKPGADGLIRGVDGRTWRMSKPESVVAAFDRPRAVTENHARVLAANEGKPAPAYGWIDKPYVQDGAIVADMDWTPRGELALNGREYRYFSPEFLWDPKTTEITRIVGGALLNDPNLDQLPALNGEQLPETSPMLKAIAAALGLTESADETACVTAITTLKAEKQTALNSAQHPDPAKFKPAAELELALNRAQTAETALQALKAEKTEAEIVSTIDAAQAEGKVLPATREYYLAMCRAEGGLEQFKKYLPAMPVVGEPHKQLDKKPGAAAGSDGLTTDELAICSQMGVSAEQFKAAKAS